MHFSETRLKGAYLVDIEPREDARGFFARSWCRREFEERGLSPLLVQASVSYTRHIGTLRGMHYQAAPYAEAKLVRCTRGAIYQVVIDLRPTSATYRRWVGVELRARQYRMLYIPEGLAHGFQTLEDDVEVTYQMSEFHTPEAERGVRYDDPVFAVRWPLPVRTISDRDRTWPDYAG